MGTDSPGELTNMIKDDYIDFDISMLQGEVDYLIVDGTLPVEPTRSAETWMNMLQVMNQTGLNMEYKVGKIAEEAIRAMGVSDLDQFKISEKASCPRHVALTATDADGTYARSQRHAARADAARNPKGQPKAPRGIA